MTVWICEGCALEHTDSVEPPPLCAICTDEREFVRLGGQKWTTFQKLERAGTTASIAEVEPGLFRLTVTPGVGIGQQALLIRTSAGNLLWEPPGFISPAAIDLVRELGGVAAITGGHPHLMGASVSWSHAFDHAPVYVAAADAAWTRRPDPAITLWSGSESPLPGVTLVQCGGHFPGSSVLHWAHGAADRGVLFTSDTLHIAPDSKSVSAMRSFQNLIPLPERALRTILERLHPVAYDRMYGSFGQVIESGARDIVQRSLERYIAWIRGDVHDFEPVSAALA